MLTHERLKELLTYDPATGMFTWHCRKGGKRAQAGCIRSDGYRQIAVDGRPFRAHRLAWLYMTGEFPSGEIDHVNRDRADNRWENLRDTDRSHNNANTQPRTRAGLSLKGVQLSKNKKRFRARISIDNRTKHLGEFATPAEAHAAYAQAARDRFGEFARLR